MTDRLIHFKPPMIRAIIEGRKTQTRREATNRNAQRYQVGDRLWVREPFNNDWGDSGEVYFKATFGSAVEAGYKAEPKWTSSIFMPRRLSRLTLTVTEIRKQSLFQICGSDAEDEGVYAHDRGPSHDCWTMTGDRYSGTPYEAFRDYWDQINGKDSYWLNPDVIAITFTAHRCNIDSPETPDGR